MPAQVVQAASTLRLIQRLATEARALQVSGSYFNGSGNAQYFYPDQNTTAATMLTEVATVSNVHKSLYLGISKHAWSEHCCVLGTGAAAFCTADAQCIFEQSTKPVCERCWGFAQHQHLIVPSELQHICSFIEQVAAADTASGATRTELRNLYEVPSIDVVELINISPVTTQTTAYG